MSEKKSLIWKFTTVTGSVRLLVEVEQENAQELHLQLSSCAVVAEDLDEFLVLAYRVTRDFNAMIGEVLRQPWSIRSFREQIRLAMNIADVIRASEVMVELSKSATQDDVRALVVDPSWGVERDYVLSLLYGLDEFAGGFLQRLSIALSVDAMELAKALGFQIEDGR